MPGNLSVFAGRMLYFFDATLGVVDRFGGRRCIVLGFAVMHQMLQRRDELGSFFDGKSSAAQDVSGRDDLGQLFFGKAILLQGCYAQ